MTTNLDRLPFLKRELSRYGLAELYVQRNNERDKREQDDDDTDLEAQLLAIKNPREQLWYYRDHQDKIREQVGRRLERALTKKAPADIRM